MISGRKVILPAVPGANHGSVDQSAASQWPPLMHANSIDGIKHTSMSVDGDYVSIVDDLNRLPLVQLLRCTNSFPDQWFTFDLFGGFEATQSTNVENCITISVHF